MAKKTSPSIKELRERAFILIEIFRNLDAVKELWNATRSKNAFN